MSAFLQFPLAGPLLRELRTRRGRSGKDVARALGVGVPTLFAIERGKTQPSLRTLIRAARYFSVPLTDLAGENVEGLAS